MRSNVTVYWAFASQAHLICLIESMDADLNPDLLNHFDSGVNYFL